MINKYKGESALIITTVIWGATFAIIKTALHSISPMMFLTLRFTTAAIILFPFVFKKLKKMNSYAVKGGLILGFLYFGGFAAQTIGLKYTSATKSGFITGTFIILLHSYRSLWKRKCREKGMLLV
jgi:drug/metabolite transporter (DMT)-like permease